MSKELEKYPRFFSFLAKLVGQSLINQGVSRTKAGKIALNVAEDLRGGLGGITTYIPKGRGFFQAERNKNILEKFNGSNFNQLAREFRLSRRRIYQILAERRSSQEESGK